jgi:hypothetical protein
MVPKYTKYWMSVVHCLFVVAVLSITSVSAFSVGVVHQLTFGSRATTSLQAKRRRPGRSEAASEAASSSSNIGDELPDFDLSDDLEESTTDSTSAISKDKSVPPSQKSIDGLIISPEMMGSANKPARSIRELINDRAIEKKFNFDAENADTSIPDLAEIFKQREANRRNRQPDSGRQPVTLPTTKQVATEDSNVGFIKKVPFILDEVTGEITPLSVLTAGTWLGIFLLVAWEVYINSPLFDRAAPMTPVVY